MKYVLAKVNQWIQLHKVFHKTTIAIAAYFKRLKR